MDGLCLCSNSLFTGLLLFINSLSDRPSYGLVLERGINASILARCHPMPVVGLIHATDTIWLALPLHAIEAMEVSVARCRNT